MPAASIDESGTHRDAVDTLIGWLDLEHEDDIDSVIYESEPQESPVRPVEAPREPEKGVEPTVNLDRSRFVDPCYTITEAADIVKVPTTTLAMWARGYVRRPAGHPEVRGEPIITSVGKPRRNQPLIPFVGLAEATVLAAIRKTDVPMQRIRPAIDQMQRGLGLPHASLIRGCPSMVPNCCTTSRSVIVTRRPVAQRGGC